MRIDVYHYFPEKLEVVHVYQFPQPFLFQIVGEEEGPALKGGKFMFIVKDTQSDVGYQVTLGDVLDAEGHVIPDAELLVEVFSDNTTVVEITPDPMDGKKGTAHFGAPGVASVNCLVKLLDGTLIGSFGAQFTVTVGDPASITGGTIQFEGLSEVPEPPLP